MNLDTDKRSIGDFKDNIEWSALNTLYTAAMSSVADGIKMTNSLLNENADDMIKAGIDKEAIQGVALSFKDLKDKINETKLLHSDRSGKVNTNNFEDYSKYLEIASTYQTLAEDTATLIGSAYMDVLNTAVMRSSSQEVKKAAKEAYNDLKDAVDSNKEEEIKNIEGKLDGK